MYSAVLRLNTLPLRSGIRQRCSVLPVLFSIVLVWKGIQVRGKKKKEVKVSLFAGDIILHIGNPKDF